MDVFINELTSTVEVTTDEAMVDPVVLRHVVQTVMARLRDEEEGRRWESVQRDPGGLRGRRH